MVRAVLTILTLVYSLTSFAKEQFSLPKDFSAQRTIRIFESGKHTLLVSNVGVFEISSGQTVELLRSDANINDAVVYNNALVLATNKGLLSYEYPQCKKITSVSFGTDRICGVSVDALGRLWVGSSYKGVYVKNKDSFELKANIPSVLSLVCTQDSNVWIGTNIGLYQLNAITYTSLRYAEEGYSGYELPDNIVERLFTDGSSNIWVLMPDNISFKRGKNYLGEIPSYGFLGAKGNEIYTISQIKDGYLFTAAQGSYYVPTANVEKEHEHGMAEVHTSNDGTYAFQLNAETLQLPEGHKDATVHYAQKLGNSIYFLTDNIGWKVKEKQLVRK